jgi:lipopolysaccharide biosynthesis regulator YciM
MYQRFPERRESLFNLVDLYNQTKDYKNVIHTLDRLEQIIGKNEQLSMESSAFISKWKMIRKLFKK